MEIEQVAYRVAVDWAPADELAMSLMAYLNTSDHRILELGPAWARGVRERLSPGLATALAELDAPVKVTWLGLLLRAAPARRDIAGVLAWLASLPVGEMYERLAPRATAEFPLPPDLDAARDRVVGLLARWHDEYFAGIDPAILTGLSADAAATAALVGTMDPLTLVERATNGVVFQPDPCPETVLLIPQYHYRPWNVFSTFRDLRIIHYPVDAVPAAPGELPPGLKRLTRALSDDNRLRILRFLSTGPQSFTAIVRSSGLAKSTVHHHMVVLRAAGLVRVHASQGGGIADSYSLRPHALDELDRKLRAFLAPEPAPGSVTRA